MADSPIALNCRVFEVWYHPAMRDIFALFLHVMVTVIRLVRPGGLRSVVAESTLIRHQLLVLNRGRKRAPNLRVSDRIIAGLSLFSCALYAFCGPRLF